MRLIGLVVLLLLVAGCSPTADNQPPRPPVPRDRDERMVISALRHLDACALIEPAATPPVAGGPHRCATEPVAGADRITVTLGVRFGREPKYRALPTDLGGSKAYLDVSEPGHDFCQVAIPVSFDLAIAVVGRMGPRSGNGDICEPTKSAAAAVVRRLSNPATGTASNWTACELLAALVGHSTGVTNDGPNGLDTCTVSEKGKTLFRGDLDYGDDPTTGAAEVRTLAGQRVAVRSDIAGCSYLWRSGSNLVVRFHATDCAKGEPLIQNLVNLLASPNAERASPQRPLPMRPDEPDLPLAGACVDFPYGTDCQPSPEVSVPQDAPSILSAAGADARVACAVAGEAVRGGFGATLTAVVGSRAGERQHCYFVEPSHATVVEVSVRSDGILADAETTGGSDLTVAGRPGRSAADKDSHRLCVLAVAGAKTGLLCVVAHFLPGRGKESDSPADIGAATRLEPAVAMIVSRYFS